MRYNAFESSLPFMWACYHDVSNVYCASESEGDVDGSVPRLGNGLDAS